MTFYGEEILLTLLFKNWQLVRILSIHHEEFAVWQKLLDFIDLVWFGSTVDSCSVSLC